MCIKLFSTLLHLPGAGETGSPGPGPGFPGRRGAVFIPRPSWRRAEALLSPCVGDHIQVELVSDVAPRDQHVGGGVGGPPDTRVVGHHAACHQCERGVSTRAGSPGIMLHSTDRNDNT